MIRGTPSRSSLAVLTCAITFILVSDFSPLAQEKTLKYVPTPHHKDLADINQKVDELLADGRYRAALELQKKSTQFSHGDPDERFILSLRQDAHLGCISELMDQYDLVESLLQPTIDQFYEGLVYEHTSEAAYCLSTFYDKMSNKPLGLDLIKASYESAAFVSESKISKFFRAFYSLHEEPWNDELTLEFEDILNDLSRKDKLDYEEIEFLIAGATKKIKISTELKEKSYETLKKHSA